MKYCDIVVNGLKDLFGQKLVNSRGFTTGANRRKTTISQHRSWKKTLNGGSFAISNGSIKEKEQNWGSFAISNGSVKEKEQKWNGAIQDFAAHN